MRRPLSAVLWFALLAAPAGSVAEPLPEPLRWLQAYVRLDTANPPGNEHRGASFLASILQREGVPSRLYVTPEGRASLVARLEGSDPTAGALVLNHHLDVVPATPGWELPPFSGEIRDGRLHGRGAIDDKSLGIAHLSALLALHRSGELPRRDVVLMAVADEEAGGTRGTGWLLVEHPEAIAGAVAVLGEGGANRVFGGEVRWWGVEVAQKRPLWLRVRTTGRAGHGSSIDLHSAPHRLIRALSRLLDRPLEYRVSDAARRYFRAVAPFEAPALRALFMGLDEAIVDGEPRHSLPPGIPNYLLDSLQVNVLEAGVRINVTPESASALVDGRLLPDTDAEAFLAELRERVGDEAEIEVLLAAPPSPPSPTDTETWRRLRQVLSRRAPVVPAFIPGVTDSRWFRERGIPAYGVSPFPLEGTAMRGIHGRDESIPVDAFLEGVALMEEIVAACAGG